MEKTEFEPKQNELIQAELEDVDQAVEVAANVNEGYEKSHNPNFGLLASRKERRAEARKNKVPFVPQYNGGSILRTKTKAELKIIRHDAIRKHNKRSAV